MIYACLLVMLSVVLNKSSSLRHARKLVGVEWSLRLTTTSSFSTGTGTGRTSLTAFPSNEGDRALSRSVHTSDRRMDERIAQAKNWVSFKLTDEQSARVNKGLGIEAELQDASSWRSRVQAKEARKSEYGKIKGIGEAKESAKLKGFLQLNPALCSGCGVPFQTKNPDHPGYLPKDMFHEHRRRSELMRARQDAIKLLDMAGLELDSGTALQLLRSASVPEEVIQGVHAMGIKLRESRQNTSGPDSPQDEWRTTGTRPRTMVLNEDTGVYEKVAPHAQEGVPEELLQPMTMEEIEAYNNRYSKFNNKKKERPTKKQKNGAESSVEDGHMTSGEGTVQHLVGAGSEGMVTTTTVGAESAVLADGTTATTSAASTTPTAADAVDRAHLKHLESDDRVCICQRCFRLQHYGQVESTLRPGWSANELLTPERFEKLLGSIKDTPSVVLCLVDIFDLRGSILRNLKNIVGRNPLVIAANKVDLLPPDVSLPRLTAWIHSEVKAVCGFHSGFGNTLRADDDGVLSAVEEGTTSSAPAGEYDWRKAKERKERKAQFEAETLRSTDVHLVSCQTGMGMDKLLSDLMMKAEQNGRKIHVMGAANVGKSSFINRLLESAQTAPVSGKNRKARRAQAKKAVVSTLGNAAKATVSNLPGTTLDFLKIQLPNGMTMIDTPGLLQVGQLTSKLNSDELRQVIPDKPLKPVTIRMEEGRCIMIGGLARVQLLTGRPCFFTVFVSSDITLHPTDHTKADGLIERHLGGLLNPPATIERYNAIGPYTTQDVEISGDSWKKSQYDVVIAGLGWVSVTGPGKFVVRVTAPKDTLVDLRPSLLPFEAPLTTVRFTGGRLHRTTAVRRTPRKVSTPAVVMSEEKERKMRVKKQYVASARQRRAAVAGRAGSSGRGGDSRAPRSRAIEGERDEESSVAHTKSNTGANWEREGNRVKSSDSGRARDYNARDMSSTLRKRG